MKRFVAVLCKDYILHSMQLLEEQFTLHHTGGQTSRDGTLWIGLLLHVSIQNCLIDVKGYIHYYKCCCFASQGCPSSAF
jgi:hypothetical protein